MHSNTKLGIQKVFNFHIMKVNTKAVLFDTADTIQIQEINSISLQELSNCTLGMGQTCLLLLVFTLTD